jgi:hypothetical protein
MPLMVQMLSDLSQSPRFVVATRYCVQIRPPHGKSGVFFHHFWIEHASSAFHTSFEITFRLEEYPENREFYVGANHAMG